MKQRKHCRLSVCLLSLAIVFMIGCGGGGHSSSGSNTPAVGITIAPTTANLTFGETKNFTATITGTTNSGVNWSVQESNGGSVDATGKYTAPNHTGTFHVVAAAAADTTKTAAAAVTVAAPNPVISSTAVTAASEGQAYSYTVTATDPAGTTLHYALTKFPQSATLSGSTISWTPITAQSRVGNDFEVTVTTDAGGSAKQAWTVTPTGNVTIACSDTYYHAQGTTLVPLDLGKAQISALRTDTYATIGTATPSPDGKSATIANVPAGAYWLAVYNYDGIAISPLYYRLTGSNFDCGYEFLGRPDSQSNTTSALQGTVSGLDPWNHLTDSLVWYSPNTGASNWYFDAAPDLSSTYTVHGLSLEYTDPTKGDVEYIAQYHQTGIGNPSGNDFFILNYLARAVTYDQLTIAGSGPADLTGTMTQPPQTTLRANIAGSNLTSVITQMHPQATAGDFYADFVLMPYAPAGKYALARLNPPAPRDSGYEDYPTLATLESAPGFDKDNGDFTANNPFPSTWTPFVLAYQTATVNFTAPGATRSRDYSATTGYADAQLPTSSTPIKLPLSPVLNPSIDGMPFGSPATISATPLITWSAPTGLTPDHYEVFVREIRNISGGTGLGTFFQMFYTDQTSLQLPAGILQPGSMYMFRVYAKRDGTTIAAPGRVTMPFAWSTAASSGMTVSGGANSASVMETVPASLGEVRLQTGTIDDADRVRLHRKR